jgi:ribonuclease HI
MKKTIKFNEFLEFIAKHENFPETLSEFSGMKKEDIRDLLLKHAMNKDNPDIEVIIDERAGDQTKLQQPSGYAIYIDGASRGNPGPSGIGIVFFDGKDEVKRIHEYIGEGTNNEAEYQALIRALQEAIKMQYFSVRIFSDSELLVKQIKGEYRVLDSKLEKLYTKAFKEIHKFTTFEIAYLGRRGNKIADSLANKAIDEELK